MKRLGLLFILVAGCYLPDPQSGGFKCDAKEKYLCPQGLECDFDSLLCVTKRAHHDLGFPDMALTYDASSVTPPGTCGEIVAAGMVSSLTNLSTVNTSGDESAIAVTNDGTRIYYLSGGALMTAPLTNARTAGTPAVVSQPLVSITGLAFATDGSLFVAGSDQVNTQIFKLKLDTPTSASLVDTHQPVGSCPITGLSFTGGDLTKDFFVSYPLAGCSMPEGRGSYIAQGLIDKQMGTFITAMPSPGYAVPFAVPDGLTLLFSSVGPGSRLYYAKRPATDALWTGPLNLNLGVGVGTNDVQAVVAGDCKTLYLVSERKGGKGGLDLWAADIAQP